VKVLFDHNVPEPLARLLEAHDIKLADEMGWARLKSGALLAHAEQAGFDSLLSGDKTIRHEQNMKGRRIAMVYMSDNHWRIVRGYVPEIQKALDTVRPGEVRAVFCGTFIRGKPSRRTQ